MGKLKDCAWFLNPNNSNIHISRKRVPDYSCAFLRYSSMRWCLIATLLLQSRCWLNCNARQDRHTQIYIYIYISEFFTGSSPHPILNRHVTRKGKTTKKNIVPSGLQQWIFWQPNNSDYTLIHMILLNMCISQIGWTIFH